MQNLYIVHGRPAWSSQFLISCINASGKFSPLRYTMTGDGDARGCVAWAVDASGERLESPEITIGMAKAEGWYDKKGSKWQTMPDLMLRYRSATLFARLYCPELTMGMKADDEIIDITPVVTEPAAPKGKRVPSSNDAERLAKATKRQEPATTPPPEPEQDQEPRVSADGIEATFNAPAQVVAAYLRSIGELVAGTISAKTSADINADPEKWQMALSAWVDSQN
jgi:hypothetical protein